jgi:hypothetical protein
LNHAVVVSVFEARIHPKREKERERERERERKRERTLGILT